MRTKIEDYGKKCRKQSLGTKEHAECMKKLAESIMLQCIEDLWERSSRHWSVDFFTEGGFSTCAAIAGMEIGDQVKLLDIVNCAFFRIRSTPVKGSLHTKRRAPSTAKLLTDTKYGNHHGIQF